MLWAWLEKKDKQGYSEVTNSPLQLSGLIKQGLLAHTDDSGFSALNSDSGTHALSSLWDLWVAAAKERVLFMASVYRLKQNTLFLVL